MEQEELPTLREELFDSEKIRSLSAANEYEGK
jgi:hypothetical protein